MTERTVDTVISRLRRKVERNPHARNDPHCVGCGLQIRGRRVRLRQLDPEFRPPWLARDLITGSSRITVYSRSNATYPRRPSRST